jgi:hypothetical protein
MSGGKSLPALLSFQNWQEVRKQKLESSLDHPLVFDESVTGKNISHISETGEGRSWPSG